MSSTVTLSSSRMLSNMSWCVSGIMWLASLTIVRSSSLVSPDSLDDFGSKPSRCNNPLVMKLIVQTSGYRTFSMGARIRLAGNAMRSGCSAAMVLGVISAKTSSTRVSNREPTAMPASPIRRMAMMVTMAAASTLTRLLPMRMSPIRRSGRLSSRLARRAPWWFCCRRCFSR